MGSSKFTGNQATLAPSQGLVQTRGGGAVWNEGAADINCSAFENNTALNPEAPNPGYVSQSRPELIELNSLTRDRALVLQGGAIRHEGGTLVVGYSSFLSNFARVSGRRDSTQRVTHNANPKWQDGGAIHCLCIGTVNVIGSSFISNLAACVSSLGYVSQVKMMPC